VIRSAGEGTPAKPRSMASKVSLAKKVTRWFRYQTSPDWNEVAKLAGVVGRTPHSARHAMGRHLIEKTGNIASVQRQPGHKNAAYSMRYSRIADEQLSEVLDKRYKKTVQNLSGI